MDDMSSKWFAIMVICAVFSMSSCTALMAFAEKGCL